MSDLPEPKDAEVFDFVCQYLADRGEGKELPLDYYLARFPGHETAVEAEYQRLARGDDGEEPPSRRIGHYQVERRLGSGGQGVVLLAEDTRLRRRVALKVLAPHLDFVSSERLQRFRREAEILSQLDHPGICPVYEADAVDGVPFLAMRYVEGRTLAALLKERRDARRPPQTRVELHEVVLWIEAAARALHEAHEHGVVHRDVKPGNLMITEQGPVLLDFGLARHEATHAADHQITRSGDVLGTLAYMAPELLGKDAADRRADVYALGVTLYECLTLALPFTAATQTALWRAIENGDAAAPRDHNHAIPVELAAVVTTAMARSPAHRYATAAELADDLQRVRRREPIHARAVPVAVRALRWIQRHPTVSVGIGAACVLIVALATSLERVRANERAASALNQAIQSAVTDEGAAAALADLVAAANRSPRTDLRNAMLQVLDACHLGWRALRTPVPPFATDPPPAIDPSNRFLALADSSGGIALRDASSGALLAERTVHPGPATDVTFAGSSHVVSVGADGVHVLAVPGLEDVARMQLPRPADASPRAAVTVSPDGALLCAATAGSVVTFATRDWQRQASIDLQAAVGIHRLVHAPVGHRVAVLGKDGSADPHGCTHCWIVDVEQNSVVRLVVPHDQDILWAAWSPDGDALALASNGGRVQVLAGSEGACVFERDIGQEVNWCAFDPTGELLLVPSDHGTELWRWRQPTPRLVGRLVHPSERTIGAAAFDRERGLFASVLRDGLVLVYSTADWRLVRQFKHRVRDVRFLQFLGPSGTLLTADLDSVSAWLLGVRPHAPELSGHTGAVTTVAMHGDGTVLSGSRDGTVRLWSLDCALPRLVLQHGSPVRRARLSRDGSRIATVAADSELRIWDAATGRPAATLCGHHAAVADVWFLDDGKGAVSIGDDGKCIVWDLAQGRSVHVLAASDAPLRSAALHPTEPWIALGGADLYLTVWNRQTGDLLRRLCVSEMRADWRTNPLNQVRGIAFDARNDRLLASLVNCNLLAFAAADDRPSLRITGDRFGGALALDPATGTVVCADYSFGRLSLLDGDTLVPLEVDGHSAHANRISAIKIASEGGVALSAGHDGQLFVWDLATRTAIAAIHTDAAILDADFSPDGRWILTGGGDGAVKLWPREPLRTAREYLARRAVRR